MRLLLHSQGLSEGPFTFTGCFKLLPRLRHNLIRTCLQALFSR
ncbi:hypothetical protein L288_18055 [Sphingobium quisquiliarum P25]|uniref:Uncharacterized protein n=1 Tax=Sphingobium quisquiliarum P25 TaxID=1329909 RepID=T0GKS6_9SPHN|nr:hypothetical protein L288_18055 [Sphingobium quisquiliarum P25]